MDWLCTLTPAHMEGKSIILRACMQSQFYYLCYYIIRWVFWTDSQNGKIERIAVSGENRQTVTDGLSACIWPIEIDYAEQSVYWANTCENTLRSLVIGESDQPGTRVRIDSPFTQMTSMTLFEDILLWNEGKTIKATNKSINLGEVVTVYQLGPEREVLSVAVEIVHPKKQPGGTESIRSC